MTKTYHARLCGDRIEWIGEAPIRSMDDTSVELDVRISEKLVTPSRNDSKIDSEIGNDARPDFSQSKDPARSQKIFEILTRLTKLPHNSFPDDAVAWQREIRKDRPLLGREENE